MYFEKNEAGEYVEVTAKLVPETEVVALKAKVNEFRQTNANLLKTNESLSAFAEILDGATNVTPDGLMKKIDAKAAQRAEALVQDMKSKHNETVEALTQQVSATTTQLQSLLLGTEVQKAGAKHGVVATAYDDVVRRAEAVFTIKEGKVAFKEDKLDSEGKPYTVDSWMSDQAKAAPHLFAPSQGPAAKRPVSVRQPAAEMTPLQRIEAGLAAKK